MARQLVDTLLSVPPVWIVPIVAGLVFLEDALFIGFVLPGETAAVLGGVLAGRGQVNVVLLAGVVVLAAVVGDTVGYEVGRHGGPRLLDLRPLRRHADRLDTARGLLAKRGGTAVFLGRFVAFFRAVMPALAGMSRMPYRRFVVWNAAGGIVWGVAYVLLGYLAGNSWELVVRTVGRGVAIVIGALVVLTLVVWRVRGHVRERSGAAALPQDLDHQGQQGHRDHHGDDRQQVAVDPGDPTAQQVAGEHDPQ